jgi:hypothetical protein
VTEILFGTVLLLERAEREIALLDRARPLGIEREIQRLLAAWHRGQAIGPALAYARGRSLGRLRRALAAIGDRAPTLSAEGVWLAERAIELHLEAELAEAIGTARFAALAAARFPHPVGPVGAELSATASAWIVEGAAATEREARFRSDDSSAPRSLHAMLSRRLGQLRLPIRLRVDPDLVSVAACGENSVVIRSGTWLTVRAAERIAQHEISGHLLPRLAARMRTDVLRCGCAGANDEQEGRALLLEQRLGLMDCSRRAELGARHLACEYLRSGATFVDAVRRLVNLGASVETAIRSMLRASRGGGLGREAIYLAAMRSLSQAFAETPALEDWFRIGRVSLDYATSQLAKGLAA